LAKGYLVRTILPKQDITAGDVTIEVIESTFSGSRVESRSKRISSTLLEKIIQSHLKTGDPMSVKNLERGLMIADDLPGANVTGRLIAGDKDNTTGVVVSVTDEPLVYGQGAIDNLGSVATGTTRYSVNALFNGPLGHGDQGSVYALHTEGMDFARFGFSLPVAYHGLRAGLNASTLKYDIINGTPGQGTSSTVGLEASYPLIRSRPKTLNLAVNIDRKLFDNVGPTGETTTHYNSWVVNSGLNWSTTDPDGSSTGSLTFSKGSINLDDSPNQASDEATANAQGAFSKLRYNLTRTQNITDKFSLFGSLAGQFTNKNLDSSEKFYVGGPTGVRAYPNNEGSGSEGHLLSLEARQSLPYNLSVAGFYDRGQVTVNKDNSYTGAADPNQLSYAGYGVSLNWDGPNNLMLKAIWARRTSDNPYPVLATGDDQDGTKRVNRFWLSASMPF
jgi:hemolysin activation/secretion protein